MSLCLYRRLPRDEIPVCNCRVGGMRMVLSARQLMAQQLAAPATRHTPSPVEALAPVPSVTQMAEMSAALAAPTGGSSILDGAPPAGIAPAAGGVGSEEDEAAVAARELVEAVFAPYADPDLALAKKVAAAAIAAAVAAVDGTGSRAATPPLPPALPPPPAPSVQQGRRRAASNYMAAAAAAREAAPAAQATMSTRRGAPVGLPLAPPAAPGSAEPLPRDGCGEQCLNR